MTDMFQDVGLFHRQFGLREVLETDSIYSHHAEPGPDNTTSNLEMLKFRTKFMEEELSEFIEGVEEGDHGKMFDALIDLVYVALGTAHLQGYPWDRGWNQVQKANMAKQRAQSADESTRGSTLDVIKPPGWTPPDIEGLVRYFGYPEPQPLTEAERTYFGDDS